MQIKIKVASHGVYTDLQSAGTIFAQTGGPKPIQIGGKRDLSMDILSQIQTGSGSLNTGLPSFVSMVDCAINC